MCNPARDEEGHVRAREVSCIKCKGRVVNEVTRVVQHHYHHDYPAQQID